MMGQMNEGLEESCCDLIAALYVRAGENHENFSRDNYVLAEIRNKSVQIFYGNRKVPLVHINSVHTTPSYLSEIRFNIIHPPMSWSS
jgi:hypothetical protein